MQLPSQPPERNFLYYFSETQIALQVLTVQQGLFWPRKCFVKLFSFFLGRKPMKIWRFKLVQSQSFSYSVSTYSTRIERNICVPVCVWLWTCTIFDHCWQRSLPHSKGAMHSVAKRRFRSLTWIWCKKKTRALRQTWRNHSQCQYEDSDHWDHIVNLNQMQWLGTRICSWLHSGCQWFVKQVFEVPSLL